MKQLIAVAAIALLVGLGLGVAWHKGLMSMGGLGPATPDPNAASIKVEWLLGDGDLLQGNDRIKMPAGANLALGVDTDTAGTLLLDGYDLRFSLPPDSATTVNFLAYKPGIFRFRLEPGGQELGTLEVLERQ